MQPLPIRLEPGADLRRALESALPAVAGGAFVLSGIGSLSTAAIRLAGADTASVIEGDLELLTLAGSVTQDGAHLHASVADAAGRVFGGHVGYGCKVRTTAEILLAVLNDWSLRRVSDATTGYAELDVQHRSDSGARAAAQTRRSPRIVL